MYWLYTCSALWLKNLLQINEKIKIYFVGVLQNLTKNIFNIDLYIYFIEIQ